MLPSTEGLYPTLKSSAKYTVADEEQLALLDMPEEQVPQEFLVFFCDGNQRLNIVHSGLLYQKDKRPIFDDCTRWLKPDGI